MPEVGAGHRAVTYDMRGSGRSPWTRSGAFSHVDDLVAVLDAAGLEQATLVGASHGGKVAVDAALERPDRVSALFLVAPALGGWDWSEPIEAYGRLEDELFEAGDLGACVELNLRTWVDGPARSADEVDPRVRARVGEMQRRILDLYAGALAAGIEPGPERRLDPPAVTRLEDVAAPAAVMVGEHDQPDMLEIGAVLAARIDGVVVETVPGAAHLPSMERPEEFVASLRRFLGRHAGR